MAENYFPDGFYTFYTTGHDGQRAKTAEFAIFNDELGFPEDEDKESIGDIFPEGPINFRTRTQIEKFLHDQHGHAHLEFSGSGLDHPAVEPEGAQESQEAAPALDETGDSPVPESAGEPVLDAEAEGMPNQDPQV